MEEVSEDCRRGEVMGEGMTEVETGGRGGSPERTDAGKAELTGLVRAFLRR